MHDATECGVWGGLFEVARASGVGMTIDKEKIIVQDAVRNVCDLFGIDPYSSISEGTLVLTCRPHKAKEVSGGWGTRASRRAWWGRSSSRGRGCASLKKVRPVS